MAKPRSPRGRHSPMLAVRVSPAEKEWFERRAAELGTNAAKLQRDRLLFDMPGYSPGAVVDLVEQVIETGRLETSVERVFRRPVKP